VTDIEKLKAQKAALRKRLAAATRLLKRAIGELLTYNDGYNDRLIDAIDRWLEDGSR